MGLTFWDKIREFHKPKHILIFIVTLIIAYLIIATSLITKKYNISPGEIAKVDIKAPRDIEDRIGYDEKIKQIQNSVQDIYNRSDMKIEIEAALRNIFNRINSINDAYKEEKDRVNAFKNEKSLNIIKDESQFNNLAKLNKDQANTINTLITNILAEVFTENIADKQEDIQRAKDLVKAKVTSSNLDNTFKDVAVAIAQSQIKPNYTVNKEATEEAKRNAIKDIKPEVIKKDQLVVKIGDQISDHQYILLQQMGLLNDNSKLGWHIYVGLGGLVFITFFIQWLYLYKYHRVVFDDSSKLMLLSIITCVSLIMARTLSLIDPFLLPLACAPMLISLLLDYRISVNLSVVNCILISCIVGFNIEITLLAILNSILGAIFLKKMQARNDILYAALYISILNVILTFSVGVLLSYNITDVLRKSGYSSIGAIVSAVLTIGFLPFFESTFDIITTIKLLELSNPNQTLLKQLLIEAPGTYHHSILVANLSELAAEQIGGNPVLARVGAYYHDVGKIKRPYFFKENQIGNDNPHSKITPNLSTLVITAHVKDGMELAKQTKLPRLISDIIEQHHGTSLVKYFYLTMKNSCEKPEDVNEEDFRYPGPIPNTKEAGIIMLADSVEAAVRSISDPTKEKIEGMVKGIIKDRLDDGQLDNCELTLKDLGIIKNSFLKSLMGIYHHRIEYPTDKWEDKKLIKE